MNGAAAGKYAAPIPSAFETLVSRARDIVYRRLRQVRPTRMLARKSRSV